MKKMALPLLFFLVLLTGCTKMKEQVTAPGVSNGKITEAPGINISTGLESGDRTLTWTSVQNAATYIVQKDVSYDFSSPEMFYMGPDNSIKLYSSPDGLTRYYRVMAKNLNYSGPWSKIVSN